MNKEILRLAIPSILANITVPLVGMVDTAIAGHIDGHAATYIGAISVGAIFFSLLYWGFSFLRTGTAGLTAQAFGRADMQDASKILLRGVLMAVAISLVMLVCQLPFMRLVSLMVDASPEVMDAAQRYFLIRIWAAPATLSLMTFRGWFMGMQDSMSSMWTDLIINVVNIVASISLTSGIGSWQGMGFDGIAMGTVVAQYCGLLYCLINCRLKYKKMINTVRISEIRSLFNDPELSQFFKMNLNLLIRSICFMGIYVGYTMIAAKFGDLYLSCSAIMMQLLMLFSYVTDGFAYAGEALTGRFIGANDKAQMRRCVRYVFVWSMVLTFLFIFVYYFQSNSLLNIFTSDESVIEACRAFLPWLLLMPPIGCAAFTWDGIYTGATKTVEMRNAMLLSVVGFFALWFAGCAIFGNGSTELAALFATTEPMEASLHLLLSAYFMHLLVRTGYLSLKYKRSLLK